MKEFNTEAVWIETASALATVRPAQAFIRYPAHIGLDVHKETIAVAVARAGRAAPESREEIANKPKTVTDQLMEPPMFALKAPRRSAISALQTG